MVATRCRFNGPGSLRRRASNALSAAVSSSAPSPRCSRSTRTRSSRSISSRSSASNAAPAAASSHSARRCPSPRRAASRSLSSGSRSKVPTSSSKSSGPSPRPARTKSLHRPGQLVVTNPRMRRSAVSALGSPAADCTTHSLSPSKRRVARSRRATVNRLCGNEASNSISVRGDAATSSIITAPKEQAARGRLTNQSEFTTICAYAQIVSDSGTPFRGAERPIRTGPASFLGARARQRRASQRVQALRGGFTDSDRRLPPD